jgi:hypothetical protein
VSGRKYVSEVCRGTNCWTVRKIRLTRIFVNCPLDQTNRMVTSNTIRRDGNIGCRDYKCIKNSSEKSRTEAIREIQTIFRS